MVKVAQAEAVSTIQFGEPASKIAVSVATAWVELAGPELPVVDQLPSVDQLELTPPFMK